MVKKHDAVEISVGEVQVGFTLAIPGDDGKPRVFRVEAVKHSWDNTPGGRGQTVKLTSEPLGDGNPQVLEYPPDARVIRVSRTYDDGT